MPRETFKEDEFKQKWSHVIGDSLLDLELKKDRIKEEFIKTDCILLEHPGSKVGLDLWITSWFYNPINLEFLM